MTLVQGLDDPGTHTLYIDDVRVIDSAAGVEKVPAPEKLNVEGRDNHLDVSWKPSPSKDVFAYRVYRSADGENFRPVATRPGWSCRYEDFVEKPGSVAHFKVSAVNLNGEESPLSEPVQGRTEALNDDQLLDLIQKGCFRYYWDVANSNSGMALEILPGDENLVHAIQMYDMLNYAHRQHHAIVEALERGQSARAEALMREHANSAKESINAAALPVATPDTGARLTLARTSNGSGT